MVVNTDISTQDFQKNPTTCVVEATTGIGHGIPLDFLAYPGSQFFGLHVAHDFSSILPASKAAMVSGDSLKA
jgi:3-oxoacyl-[acyl-carrier-protein] synthase III